MSVVFKMPPEGTSAGSRRNDGAMWFAAESLGKPCIVYCVHAGTWLASPMYSVVATFERAADRDFVLELHRAAVTEKESS